MIGSELKARLAADDEFTPLLPHELRNVHGRMQTLIEGDMVLRGELSDAIGPSDWHDNPAYEACLAEMERLGHISVALGPLVSNGVEVAYPDQSDTEVTIGSHVLLSMGGDEFHADILGQNAFKDLLFEKDPDVESVSVRSPMGFSLLGVVAGATAQYTSDDGREHEVAVVSVDQTFQAQTYGSQQQ